MTAREVDVRPAPAWVERAEADASVAVAKENVRWGLYDVLRDHQVRVDERGEWQYFRTVRKVLSPGGVQNASELSLDFDPSFQRLTVHDVTVIRDGARIDALRSADVRVIDKEDDSDQRIYDGERTALIFIRDVRSGDAIDYSWSLEGANPILGGRYTDEYDLSSGVPARRIRHRLVWPAGRPLQWQGVNPTIAVDGDEQLFVWERSDVPALDVEDAIPTWYEPWESIRVTEFASWSEVAEWADALFVLDERSVEEVKKLAARIYGENETRDARITAAIRFVQDEIRYLGIEMGKNSHQPHQPWETLEARWGDCKDKTLLLVALLRELGLGAHPAMVSTRLGSALERKLPSPFLFDHVIVQVVDAGRVYWIDPTISEQGGSLTTIETPNDGFALLVHAGTSELTRVVTNATGSTLVEQTYTTTDYAKPTILVMKTTFTGFRADAARAELSAMSLEDFAGGRINDLATDQPRIEADGLPRVEDDRARNVITVTEKYRLPALWKEGHWTWYPRVLDAHLRRPETMIRSMPLAFDHPLDVRQTVTFDFPEEVEVEKSASVVESDSFRYEYSVDRNGRSVYIKQSLRSRRDFVPADEVAEHLTKLNAVWSGIGYRLSPPGAQPAPPAAASTGAAKWGLGLFIVAAFVAVCWTLATRRKPREEPVAFRPGEAPVSALSVTGAEEIHRHLAGLACACGAPLGSAADIQRARYAEREMTIAIRSCRSCGREQSIYFTAA